MSLVLQLQEQATARDVRVADLLRTSLVVATKLGVDEFGAWAQQELTGYAEFLENQIPTYRHVRGELLANNPLRGWVPVIVADPAIMKKLEWRAVAQSIAELEDFYHAANSSNTLHIPLAQEVLLKLFSQSQAFKLGMIPTLVIGKPSIRGIVDAVRNEVLRWSLELERRGVLGEGMTFSTQEKTRAAAINYHIGSFTGVWGNVSSSQVQIGDYASIHGQLKAAGVPREARNDLEDILDELKSTPPDARPGVVQRGLDWLAKYGPAIGTLSDTIRGWLEAAARAAGS